MRSPGQPLPSRLAAIVGGLLAVTTLWAGAATWYLVFHDEALARFFSQQGAMQYAYEERISALRLQLDRAAVERVAVREAVDGRLAALSERQASMEKRQALLSGLTGEIPVPRGEAVEEAAKVEAVRPSGLGSKPVPTSDALELRPRGDDTDAFGRRSALEVTRAVAKLEERLDTLAAQQSFSVGRIAEKSSRNARRLRGVIARIGLDPSRLARPPVSGTGGPLVPIAADPFGMALAEAQRWVGDEENLRRVAATLPLRQPIAGAYLPSSGFGPRLDPFTRGLAMHTGLDLKAEHGEPAHATAAEYAGGYGNMVELDHGNGITTRYAHLSALSVVPGQWVVAGGIVGRVGSTGRSTGSHLHYETRIDGEAVDPQRFLRAATGLDGSAMAEGNH